MWSFKNRIPFGVRLFGLALLMVVSAVNAVWSAVDGDYGHDFWIPLILMGCFAYWLVQAYFSHKRLNQELSQDMAGRA